MTKLLRFISEEESDGGTGNILVDKVFTDFLKFSFFGDQGVRNISSVQFSNV